MVVFRHSQEVRDAQAALNAWYDNAVATKTGLDEDNPEYQRLNDAVNEALRAEQAGEERG